MKLLSRSAVAAIVLAFASAAPAQDKPVQLKFSHWVPPTHPMHAAAVTALLGVLRHEQAVIAVVPNCADAALLALLFFFLSVRTLRLRRNLNISSPAISFAFTESIHRIAEKFQHEHAKGRRVFLFSSVSAAEGKSTLAANTAISMWMTSSVASAWSPA